MPSRVISFLRGETPDYKGRKLTELQSMPDWKLERTHDVIQWLFPTDIPSQHSQEAPVLSAEDVAILKDDLVVQGAIQMSLTRMIWFYQKDDYWISQKNHNFLRLTRILRCLWLCGLTHDYVSLQKALDEVFIEYADIIGEETYLYWKNANNNEFVKDPTVRAAVLAYYKPAPPQIKETPTDVAACLVLPPNQELTDAEADGLDWRYV
jgi:hypothetical protein